MKKDQKKPIPSPLQGQYAGFISRFLAFLVDILVIVLSIVVVGATISLILNFFGLTAIIDQIEASSTIQGSILRWITAVWGVTVVAFLYFTISWTVTSGKTLGKGLLGLRIVPMNGQRMTLLRAILRYIAFWIAVLAFGLGVLWILVSNERKGWHDKMAKTCVIYDWPAREDEGALYGLRDRWTYVKHTRRRLGLKHKADHEDQAEISSG